MITLNILIVEDDPQKRDILISALKAPDDLRTIHVAESAGEARARLQENHYDLLILDIALPPFNGERPISDLGLTLLREVTESGLYKCPKYILGVTANEEAVQIAQPTFHEKLWRMIYCQPGTTVWVDPIAKFADHIATAAKASAHRIYTSDICIVTALRSPELDAVYRLPWSWKAALPLDESTYYHQGEALSGSKRLSITLATAPRMGMVPACILVSKMVQKIRPRILIMAGICAGIKGKTELGDIIVATETCAWESGKLIEGQGFEPEPRILAADDALIARFDQLRTDHRWLSNVRESWSGQPPSSALNLRLGPIATGSPVVADKEVVTRILGLNRKTIGIDMEAFAVQAAAMSYGDPKPRTIVVKSVCDFADCDKSNDWQNYAAYTSAQAIQELVERFGGELVAL